MMINRSLKRFIILILFFALTKNKVIAGGDWKYHAQFNFGCAFYLNWGKGQAFPGLRMFSAFSVNSTYKKNVITNYSCSFSLYSKTIGADLNPLYNDLQFDIVNGFSIGYGSEYGSFHKQFRTLNNSPYTSVSVRNKYAGIFTTNWVLNKDKRNQFVGSISGSFPGFTVNYSNDGAAPFTFLPLADLFDRWWTGGGAVYGHARKGYNIFELGFDQFTGYEPQLYELAGILGIDIPPYNWEHLKREKDIKKTYNTSTYYLRVHSEDGFGFETGVMGSLRSRDGRKIYGVQDIIHYKSGYSLHPNHDDTKFYLGGLYLNQDQIHVKK